MSRSARQDRRRRRQYRRALPRAARPIIRRPGRPDITERPAIILNLTAVGVEGYYDDPDQPHGLVLLGSGALVPVHTALKAI